MTHYLLDTNIISDLVRNMGGRAATRLALVGSENVCTSIIVAAELRFGVLRKASPRVTYQVETLLWNIEILPFAAPDDVAYARIRHDVEKAGSPVGGNDLMIAAQAVSRGLTLVSDNEREFSRVTELHCENWLR